MKKIILYLIICIIILGTASCNGRDKEEMGGKFIRGENGAVGIFSYNGYLNSMGTGGIRKDPSEFVNTTKTKVKTKEKAIELAKKEITETKGYRTEYKCIDVYYDKSTKMWAINFNNGDLVMGGDQMVFIDSNGITKLFMYGE